MSTRPIREALNLVDPQRFPYQSDRAHVQEVLEAAMEAVAVIENMAKTLVPAMAEEIRANRLPHAASVLESIAKEAP